MNKQEPAAEAGGLQGGARLPYLEVIAKDCLQALNILDRFHMVAKLSKALDEVRAGEAHRMVREGYEPVL